MHIERGSINTILVNARPTLTPSRWLLWFRDPERNANVYCLCTALVGGSPTLIRFTETDTPTALSGEVKLSPPGNWELKVYEQTSTTNLSPANANRLVEAIDVLVVGEVEDETGWSGDPCPPCEGGGPCDPTTVNGTESDTPTITVVQGGVEVGTLNPATGVHTVPECEECEDAEWTLKDEAGNELDSGLVASGGEADIVAPDASWTLKDQDDEVISTGTILSGGSSDIVAPPATYTIENTAGDLLAFDTIQSGQSGVYVAPNGTVTIKNLNGDTIGTQAVKSAGAVDFVAPIPLKFLWQAGDADTFIDPDTGEGWEVTADEAGTYTTYTQTGTNGTLTYSLNGGGYVALSGTIVLTVGDTITVRRTTTTNAGTVRWAP